MGRPPVAIDNPKRGWSQEPPCAGISSGGRSWFCRTTIFIRVTPFALSWWLIIGAGLLGAQPPEEPAEGVCTTAPAARLIDPEYYRVDLVPTRVLPGLARADGVARARFADSPFAIALTGEGAYATTLDVEIRNLPETQDAYVVWISTPELDRVTRLGTLSASGRVSGTTDLLKYLVVVSKEPAGSSAERWSGPIVMRGMSRSGFMHTMAGHGPFETEPCASYGYY